MPTDLLAEACFDRHPDHLAVVDESGVIVRINEAWKRFGRENGLADNHSCLGTDYLAVCERARGHCAGEAVEMYRQLRTALDGRDDVDEVVYPCFAPHVPRWFAVKLFPLEVNGQRHVAIAHQNITALVMSQNSVLP